MPDIGSLCFGCAYNRKMINSAGKRRRFKKDPK